VPPGAVAVVAVVVVLAAELLVCEPDEGVVDGEPVPVPELSGADVALVEGRLAPALGPLNP
jgi:hypothetical protein